VRGGGVIGATLYALAMLALRVKEAQSVTKAIQGKLNI
jgi:hypothetical protein